jgi:hypothetical protein
VTERPLPPEADAPEVEFVEGDIPELYDDVLDRRSMSEAALEEGLISEAALAKTLKSEAALKKAFRPEGALERMSMSNEDALYLYQLVCRWRIVDRIGRFLSDDALNEGANILGEILLLRESGAMFGEENGLLYQLLQRWGDDDGVRRDLSDTASEKTAELLNKMLWLSGREVDEALEKSGIPDEDERQLLERWSVVENFQKKLLDDGLEEAGLILDEVLGLRAQLADIAWDEHLWAAKTAKKLLENPDLLPDERANIKKFREKGIMHAANRLNEVKRAFSQIVRELRLFLSPNRYTASNNKNSGIRIFTDSFNACRTQCAKPEWMKKYWYLDAFNQADFKALRVLASLIDSPYSMLELGCGPEARGLKIYLNAVLAHIEEHGLEEEASLVAKIKLVGVDYLQECVESSVNSIGKQNVDFPKESFSFVNGDFTRSLEGLGLMNTNAICSLMNSTYYALNKKMLRGYAGNVDRLLMENGVLLLDGVKLDFPEDFPENETLDSSEPFKDLKNYYDLLARNFSTANEEIAKSEVAWNKYPIYTQEPGEKGYPRCIVQVEEMLDALNSAGGEYELCGKALKQKNQKKYSYSKALKMGKAWVASGDLGDFLSKELEYRLLQIKDGKKQIQPYYYLKGAGTRCYRSVDYEALKARLGPVSNTKIKKEMNKLAIGFVRGYTKQYSFIRKVEGPRKETKEEPEPLEESA